MQGVLVDSGPNMSKNKLVIFGDKWVYGTWKSHNDANQPLWFNLVPDQPGMSAVLSDHFDVEVRNSYSNTNDSVWTVLRLLKEYLVAVDNVEQHTILVFQSDFNTDFEGSVFDINYDQLIKSTESMDSFFETAADQFYKSLDAIAESQHITIYVCGGITDVNEDLIKKYANLKVVCASWVQLMLPDHSPSLCSPLTLSKSSMRHLKKIIARHRRNDLAQQLGIKDDSRIFYTLQTSNRFMPAMPAFPGFFSPNLESHALIANHILDFFKT